MSSALTPLLPVGLGTVIDANDPGFSFTFFRFFEPYGTRLSATFLVTTYLPVLEDIPEGNTGINATLTIAITGNTVVKEFVRIEDTIAPLTFEVVVTFDGTSADARIFSITIDGSPQDNIETVFGISGPIFIVTNDYPDSALTGTGTFKIEANWGTPRNFIPSDTINCPTSIDALVNSPNNPYSGGNLFLVEFTNSINPGNGVLISACPEGFIPIPVAYTTSITADHRGFTLMPTMAVFTSFFDIDRNWEITLNAIQAGADPNAPFLISEDSISAVTFVETISDLVIVGAAGGLVANFGGTGSGNGSGVSFYPTPPHGAIPDPILLADPSGIYTIIPGSFHDVLYNRNGDEKISLPIPTPFARTAYLGE